MGVQSLRYRNRSKFSWVLIGRCDDFGVGLSTLYKKALLNLVVFLGYYLQLSHADPQV